MLVNITTPTSARTSGNSYEIICAAARNPPMSEYLLLEPQPAMMMPITSSELIATRNTTPVASAVPGRPINGENGSTANEAITAALVMGNKKANSTATTSCTNCPEKIKEDNWLPMPVARMLALVMACLHLVVSFQSGL